MSVTSRRFRTALLANLLLAGIALGQPPSIPTSATVGVPYSFDFGQEFQSIPQLGSENGVSFSWSFTPGGNLPPGLTLTSAGLLSGTPTTAGTYTFSVSFSFSISAMGFSQSINSPAAPFTITVTGRPTGPQTSVLPGLLSFPFTSGAGAATQVISVINRGSAAANFTAAASTRTGGNWLTASASGSAPAFGAGAVQVTANPAGIAPGTYGGNVAVTVGSTTTNVSVVMTVSGATQLLSLSQSGLTFRALAGGGAPPPQTFNVLGTGSGSISWTLKTSTLSGGASWLSASPATGSSGGASAPTIQIAANPAGLAAGDYYGQIQVSSPGVTNSPQTVSVVLTVADAATTGIDPVLAPTGLIFVGSAGAASPKAKTFTITNITAKAATYTNAAFVDKGTVWYAAAPAQGTVNPNQPVTISVQPNTSGLAAGVYTGDLAVHFTEANTTHHVAILLVMLPAGVTVSSLKPLEPRLATGCTPTKLYPVFTQLGQSFTTTAAWPTALEITAVDDCGTAMTSGSVVANFSTGDPVLSLTALGDGRWTGTWQARNLTSAAVTITANAQLVAPPISGTASIGGNSQANKATPVISANGPVNGASLAPGVPVAPGSIVAINGSNLGQGLSTASQLPLGTQLNGTQVIIAGEPVPLVSTSDGQISGVIPFDVPVNATHQVIVQRGNAYSVPGQVTIAPAGPAVFTVDSSGGGLGQFDGFMSDGTPFTVDENDPVTAGDTIVIHCTGLGSVTPAVPSGSMVPTDTPSPTDNPVTVTIGGQDSPVSFSGLAPGGVAGLYQINAAIPDGITPGDVQLVITVQGQTSPPVIIPVQ